MVDSIHAPMVKVMQTKTNRALAVRAAGFFLLASVLTLCFGTIALPYSGFASAQARSPQDVVNLFMKVYGTHRMREILPYTLPAFRDGMEPELWLTRTQRILRSIGYVRLEGVIQSVVVKHDEATVVVATRIKTKAVTGTQTEIYRLRLKDQRWKLLDLEVADEVIEEKPPRSVS